VRCIFAMDDQKQRVEAFRTSAAELREEAETASPYARSQLLEIAMQYEAVADQIECAGMGKKDGEN